MTNDNISNSILGSQGLADFLEKIIRKRRKYYLVDFLHSKGKTHKLNLERGKFSPNLIIQHKTIIGTNRRKQLLSSRLDKFNKKNF